MIWWGIRVTSLKSCDRFLLLSAVLLGSNACSQQPESPELNKNFTSAELRDLEKLTLFFKKQICGDDGTVKTCLDSLNPYLLEYGWQPILENISFSKQENVYASFESNLFNEIWRIGKSRNLREGWERKSVYFNFNGKYAGFLKEMSKRNKVLEAYNNGLISATDFVGIVRLEQEVYRKTGKVNLKDPAIQVIFAVHYLSQNDQAKRVEQWNQN